MRKGHWFLTFALVLVAVVPVAAQQPTIGVYFDLAGTQSTAVLNGGEDEVHKAYVIGFFEGLVGGAAFRLDVDTRIEILTASFPLGVQIGDLQTGMEIGLQNPVAGYFGVPVRFATLLLSTGANLIANGTLVVAPFASKYEDVMISDADGILYPADGLTATLTIPVGTESNSWGRIKNLYE